MTRKCHVGFGGEGAWFTCPSNWERQRALTCIGWHRPDLLGPNETIPEGTVGSDVVEMSEASNKAPNRK